MSGIEWLNFRNRKQNSLHPLRMVPLRPELLMAATQFWDPDVHVFRFGMQELCPTVEEFRLYLDCHNADEPVVPLIRECMWRILRARLNLSIGLARSLVANGNLNILRIYEMFSPTGDLTDHVFQAWRLFAFCLCLLASFLLVPNDGRVNPAIIGVALQLELRRDLSPLVLAETLLGLDQMKRGQTQVFGGSPLLLQMWLCDKLNVLQVPSGDWLYEARTWARRRFVRIHDTVEDWMAFLADLREDGIMWRCHWLPLPAMTVSNTDAQMVVLAGLTQFTFYIPLRILRQLGIRQRVPTEPTAPFVPPFYYCCRGECI